MSTKTGYYGNPYQPPVPTIVAVAEKPYSSTSKTMPKKSTLLWVALNALRMLSLVALSLVVASQVLACVSDVKAIQADNKANKSSGEDWECDYYQYSSVPTQAGGEFWSISNRVFVILQSLVLILSELSLPVAFIQKVFESHLAILSDIHGLGFLGVVQVIIGCGVLSKYVDKFEQIAAWLLVIVGGLNTVAGIGFRTSAKMRRLVFKWGKLPGETSSVPPPSLPTNDGEKQFSPEVFDRKSSRLQRSSTSSSETLIPSPQMTRPSSVEAREAREPTAKVKGPRVAPSPMTVPLWNCEMDSHCTKR